MSVPLAWVLAVLIVCTVVLRIVKMCLASDERIAQAKLDQQSLKDGGL